MLFPAKITHGPNHTDTDNSCYWWVASSLVATLVILRERVLSNTDDHTHVTDEEKAEFSLDFGTAATSLIMSSVSFSNLKI